MVTKRRKKATKKKVTRKAPAKKKSSGTKVRAVKSPRKKAARKAPAKKTATRKKTARKAPAKKKATRKKAARKGPAKKKAAPAPKAETFEAVFGADEVVQLHQHTELSITQLWLDTGLTRKTIRKRIADSGVQPSSKHRGYPVYRLKDILPALFQQLDGVTDPDKLTPFERRAYYQGELDKLKLQAERGELVPSFEVERQMSNIFKVLTQHLDTLPDTLERDVGANAAQLMHIERAIDKVREAMYTDLVAAGADNADRTTEISA